MTGETVPMECVGGPYDGDTLFVYDEARAVVITGRRRGPFDFARHRYERVDGRLIYRGEDPKVVIDTDQ